MSEVVPAEKRLAYLRHYLEQNVAAAVRIHGKETPWSRYDQLILERGVPFCGRVRSEDEPFLKAWRRKNRPRKKECFANAQQFAIDPDSRCQALYHEGYALGAHGPFAHGWTVLTDGRVVDFTLDLQDEGLSRSEVKPACADEVVYLGVPVPCEMIAAHISAVRCYERLAHVHHLRMERFP